MKIIRAVREMQDVAGDWRRAGGRIALVPTMGCLHAGHLSLLRMAREHADHVVVSIFVNPTQFGPSEDFDRYPRTFPADARACREHGAAAVFHPQVSDLYPEGFSTWVTEEALSNTLCGQSRPGHFRGVATVVCKLFNAVLPDVAVFGRKDAQQALIIQRMVRDLNFPLEILVAPIVREPDGLAMSSRNAYLSADERRRALSIHRGLTKAELAFADGETDSARLRRIVIRELGNAQVGRVEYVELVACDTLRPVAEVRQACLLAVAAHVGSTRLIDNCLLGDRAGLHGQRVDRASPE